VRTTVAPRRVLADRVYYGWIIALACFLASVAVFGTTYAFGVFYDVFLDAFEASGPLVAVVFGVQTALLYVSGIGVGRVIERYGRRRVAAVSGTLLVGGLVWTARAQSYLELLVAFGVVAAVGMGGLYIVSYATLPTWFDRRRGTASALASAGLGVGLVVVPPSAEAVIDGFGWRAALIALAGLVAALVAVVVVLFADDPAAVGADTSHEFGTTDGGRGEPAETDRSAVRDIVTSGPFLLVFAGWTLAFAPVYVVFAHVVRHASATGIGRSVGVAAVAAIGVATTLGRVSIGPLSDRLGRPRTFAGSAVLLSGATAWLGVASGSAQYLAAVALFGVGYAGCGGLIGAVTADLFGNRALDTLFGVLSVSFAVTGLFSPPLAGVWFEAVGSYRLAFVGFGVVGVLGAGCVALGARVTTDG